MGFLTQNSGIPAVLCRFILAKDPNQYPSHSIRFRCLLHLKALPWPKRPQENKVSNSDPGVSPHTWLLLKAGEDQTPRDRAALKHSHRNCFSPAAGGHKRGCEAQSRAAGLLFPLPLPSRKAPDLQEIRPYSLVFSHLIHLTTSSTTDILSDVTDCCNLYSGQPLSKLPESLQGLVSLTHD